MLTSTEFQTYTHSPEFLAPLGLTSARGLSFSSLGQGEYNLNYSFCHPLTGQELVLRLNTASQMHLERQTAYEYNALKLLAPSGRTPRPLFHDDSRSILPYGVLVMERLPGRPLDYHRDLSTAAAILADIHSLPVGGGSGLIAPRRPLRAIYEECQDMADCYFAWAGRERATEHWLKVLLSEIGELPLDEISPAPRCLVNTELNSGNFLINSSGPSYLIDWEKPLLSEAAQDLGHFLAPTTTFWKTDVILAAGEMQDFVAAYIKAVGARRDTSDLPSRLPLFLKVTCLRGVTWCAMAEVEYARPGRPLENSDTREKIRAYLAPDFLKTIAESYVRRDFLEGIRL